MKRWIRLAVWLIPAVMSVHACGGNATTDSTSGNTNWLKLCDKQADCGEGLSCLCNVCQEICTTNSDCDLAGLGSRCAVQPSSLACGDASSEGERVCVKGCDVIADCERNDLVCRDDVCVPRTAMDPDSGDAASAREDATSPPLAPPEGGTPDATPAVVVPDGSNNGPDVGVPNGFVSGDGFEIAYAFGYVPSRGFLIGAKACSAIFDGAGYLSSYQASVEESLAGLSDQVGGFGDTVHWGQWDGDSVQGEHGGIGIDLDADLGAFHYALGRASATLPTGFAMYEQSQGTTPSVYEAGQSAEFNYVVVAIDYFTNKVGLELRVTLDERQPLTFETNGGVADISDTQVPLVDGHFSFSISGYFAVRGTVVDDGEAIILSYKVRDVEYSYEAGTVSDGGPDSFKRDIFGAAGILRTQ